ncbi:OmpA family protein [Sinorhizobium numidicum]|uniref:OmpA family protein n=1 Tax=Sinorhizobium numidicum TaxID=680248 RepID=A0ABY8CQF2_9HYPH|nr:OmpA family protein [Sinorhizobium numidicum]WEX74142.1 OmpA family protein [Sinorhizobium numidicum]WEX80127.1 OmpA family protein [Sinorhizobium numidicum]
MVATSEPATKLEHRGYNRGLILGLTMAESMLLLVFCLLLVAAAIINAERNKALQAQRKLQAAQRQIAELRQEAIGTQAITKELNTKIAVLEMQLRSVSLSPADRKKFEKEWRDLVVARGTVQRLRDQGLSPERLAELEKAVAVLQDGGLSTADAPALEKRLRDLLAVERKQADAKPHEWPPIINLSEAEGYFFRSGSAQLTRAFEEKLRGSIASKIAQSLRKYEVDIIEVIGHTDEQPISRAASDLDQDFIDILGGKKAIAEITAADNAGLGLARAMAVANVLRADHKLNGATILPMSAAQLVLPGDRLTTGEAGNVESRRRIEIRIRGRNASLGP